MHKFFVEFGPVDSREKEAGIQGGSLNPLGLFLLASLPSIWRHMSAFVPS